MPKGGFEPPFADDTTGHACDKSITQPLQNPTLVETPSATSVQKDTIPARPQDISLHGEYGICMGDFAEDLAIVVAAWDSLPAAVKAGIVAMVKASRQQ
jgi:hypothetical protein